mmetsp:Transcript_23123/g.43110  ORF Transcript_23123/g.43110 Transcript_23123/m.43110 type:complete len:356 (-) Transcript_23123:84-1151(-)
MNPLVCPQRPGDFNQAMMELGATLCKPTSPRCSDCPLSSICHARQLTQCDREASITSKLDDIEDMMLPIPKEVTEFPKKAPKKAPKDMLFGVCVLKMKPYSKDSTLAVTTSKSTTEGDEANEVKYLLVRRPPKGLLENQWEFPSVLVNSDAAVNNMSAAQKTKHWLSLCQHHLQDEFGIQVNEGHGLPQHNGRHESSNRRMPFMFHTDTIVHHPEPIVHVFSHQRHTMNIIEATFDPHFCVGPCTEGTVADIPHRNLFNPWRTKQSSTNDGADGSREVMWMTLSELKQRGVTTGVQKIITATTTKTNIKAEESATKKKIARKKTKRNDNGVSGSDSDVKSVQSKKGKISHFFKSK